MEFIMFTQTMFITLATSIDRAKRQGDVSWENINNIFHEHAFDRRYKVYFGTCTDDMHGIWYIGDPDRNGHKCYLEFQNDRIYVRPVRRGANHDLYEKKPCYEITRIYDNGYSDDIGYCAEWQDKVLI